MRTMLACVLVVAGCGKRGVEPAPAEGVGTLTVEGVVQDVAPSGDMQMRQWDEGLGDAKGQFEGDTRWIVVLRRAGDREAYCFFRHGEPRGVAVGQRVYITGTPDPAAKRRDQILFLDDCRLVGR